MRGALLPPSPYSGSKEYPHILTTRRRRNKRMEKLSPPFPLQLQKGKKETLTFSFAETTFEDCD